MPVGGAIKLRGHMPAPVTKARKKPEPTARPASVTRAKGMVFAEKYLPTPTECAHLLVANIRRFMTQRPAASYFKMSEPTVRKICARSRIEQGTYDQIVEELDALGWMMMWNPKTYYFFPVAFVDRAPNVNASRIAADVEAVTYGSPTVRRATLKKVHKEAS